jgi:hypothetical protein
MRLAMQLLVAAAVVIALLVFLYWRQRSRKPGVANRPSRLVLVLAGSGIVLCGWSLALEEPDLTYARRANPLVIAIAFDVSPSMLAIPDPQLTPDLAPRFARARNTLLAFFAALEERGEMPFVAMAGFTRKAEILMGWDQSAAQVRDVLQYGLSPDLFGSSGTSIEAAVDAIDRLFGMLPAAVSSPGRKIAIVVSDGEDTLPPSSVGYALEDLQAGAYEVIALQAGLLHEPEGVPAYDRVGEFLGFQVFGGREFTVPDAGLMSSLAEAPDVGGLYVRAEDPQAVERMLEFATASGRRTGVPEASLLATLGMFLVVAALCGLLVK